MEGGQSRAYFKSSDCIHAGEKKGWISYSQYLVYLSVHKIFTAEIEKLLDYYAESTKQIVFISDGAPWIKNWIEDAYPNAILILDFIMLWNTSIALQEQNLKRRRGEKNG